MFVEQATNKVNAERVNYDDETTACSSKLHGQIAWSTTISMVVWTVANSVKQALPKIWRCILAYLYAVKFKPENTIRRNDDY